MVWSPGRALGRIERLEVVCADPEVMGVVCQRVADGESLKGVGRSWELPVGRFVEWVMADAGRRGQYEAALRIRADELAHEALEVADNDALTMKEVVMKDGSVAEVPVLPDVPRDSLRVKTRLALAGLWDRERYGQGGAAAGRTVRVVVDRECAGGVGWERVAVEVKE